VIGIDPEANKVSKASSFLIRVYGSQNQDKILAGAKLKSDNIETPFRFQLFEENILVDSGIWNDLTRNYFDQYIRVDVCHAIQNYECNGPILLHGEAISKYVKIGIEDSEKRGVRLYPYIELRHI